MNKKPEETNEKASRKAGRILRQLDEAQLEQVAGASCRTCGLVLAPELPLPCLTIPELRQ